MTIYLTDRTDAGEIAAAKASGIVHAVKYYPAGATTNSDSGVTALARAYPALAAMEEHGVVLSVHGEVTDPDVDVFDRERVFVERSLTRDRPRLPGAQGRAGAHHHARGGRVRPRRRRPRVAATITPQHLLYSRNAMLAGGVRPHLYCLPILKRETHRAALVAAAISGNPRFFLGTDSAPARAAHQGERLRLRRLLLGAGRAGALRRGLRRRRRARPARRLRQPLRRRLLRAAAARRHRDAGPRGVDRAVRMPAGRAHASCRCAPAKPCAGSSRDRVSASRGRATAALAACYPDRSKPARPSPLASSEGRKVRAPKSGMLGNAQTL